MSTIAFFGVPTHGHVNPTLGLVSELISNGETVIYFASEPFREMIEATGAIFKHYSADLDIFKIGKDFKPGVPGNLAKKMTGVLLDAEQVVTDILEDLQGYQIGYIIHSAAFPFTKIMAQILKVPTVSSLAVFAGLDKMMTRHKNAGQPMPPGAEEMMENYRRVAHDIETKFNVTLPESMLGLLYNKGDINLVYTSKYFAPDEAYFDDTFKFVGPPVYPRHEDLDLPFDELAGKKVLYISLGTIFGNFNRDLYDTFFKAFADWNGIVVMAAYNVDLSEYTIPANFIVRNYVPQSALMPYVDAAITHAGMNSISDLINSQVPFVALPMGADQPILAQRAQELGAAIALDVTDLNPQLLRESIEQVMTDTKYKTNSKTISDSFSAAGGYPKAVEEIFKMKKEKGIVN